MMTINIDGMSMNWYKSYYPIVPVRSQISFPSSCGRAATVVVQIWRSVVFLQWNLLIEYTTDISSSEEPSRPKVPTFSITWISIGRKLPKLRDKG